MPTGFLRLRTSIGKSCSSYGVSAQLRAVQTTAAIARMRAGRHRGDGSRPSGSSSGSSTPEVTSDGAQTQDPIQSAAQSSGNGPSSAYSMSTSDSP